MRSELRQDSKHTVNHKSKVLLSEKEGKECSFPSAANRREPCTSVSVPGDLPAHWQENHSGKSPTFLLVSRCLCPIVNDSHF